MDLPLLEKLPPGSEAEQILKERHKQLVKREGKGILGHAMGAYKKSNRAAEASQKRTIDH